MPIQHCFCTQLNHLSQLLTFELRVLCTYTLAKAACALILAFMMFYGCLGLSNHLINDRSRIYLKTPAFWYPYWYGHIFAYLGDFEHIWCIFYDFLEHIFIEIKFSPKFSKNLKNFKKNIEKFQKKFFLYDKFFFALSWTIYLTVDVWITCSMHLYAGTGSVRLNSGIYDVLWLSRFVKSLNLW